MITRTVYIVWNEAKNEGIAFTNRYDAEQVKTGNFENPCSSIGDAFFESYCDDERTLQTVEIPDPDQTA